MRDACVAKMSVDIDRALFISALWETISEVQLINFLTKPEVGARDSEQKLRVVCAWIDGGMTKNQLKARLHRFGHLLEFVDLTSITESSLIDIISSNYAVTESRRHR